MYSLKDLQDELEDDLKNCLQYLKEREQAKDKANILVANNIIKILKGLIKKYHEH
jgi:hypothetical protein